MAATDDPTRGAQTAWAKFGSALPNVLVTDLTYDPTDNVLAAATFGRGFWQVNGLSNFAGQQAPVLSSTTFSAAFTQGGSPTGIIDPTLTVMDADDTNLSGATLTLTNPLDGANEMVAVNTAGTAITASAYNPTSGQLRLTGTDTLANYQQVLRSATYADTAQAPNHTARVITAVVSDGFASCVRETTTVTFNAAAANAPAVQNNQTAPARFTADGAPVAVDRGVSVSDSGSTTLRSATLTITNVMDTGHEVLAADTTGTAISAAYDPNTGVLTLSGTDTVAHYQQVLDSVTYDDTALVPNVTPRVLTLDVNDGTNGSLTDSFVLDVVPVNHAPVLAAGATFTLPAENENGSPAGTAVVDLLDSVVPANAVSEADPNADLGIAVVGVDNSHGTWQFSIDGGASWQGFDAPAVDNATLLTSDDVTQVRFVPAAGFSGTVGAGLRFRIWNQSTGTPQIVTGDVDGTTADTTVNSGSSPFSSGIGAAGITVNAVTPSPVSPAGPPVALNDLYAIRPGKVLVVSAAAGVLRAGSAAGDAPLTAVLVQGPRHGRLVLNADGSFVYRPKAGFKAGDLFVYRVVDVHGTASAPATVSLVGRVRGGKHHAQASARRKAQDAALDLVFAQLAGRP